MAVEWTIMIEGRNEYGDTCREEIRIDKSWEYILQHSPRCDWSNTKLAEFRNFSLKRSR
jgi:hypothetical protein